MLSISYFLMCRWSSSPAGLQISSGRNYFILPSALPDPWHGASGVAVLDNCVRAPCIAGQTHCSFLFCPRLYNSSLTSLLLKTLPGLPLPTELNRVHCKLFKTAALQPQTPFCYSPKNLPLYASELPSGSQPGGHAQTQSLTGSTQNHLGSLNRNI